MVITCWVLFHLKFYKLILNFRMIQAWHRSASCLYFVILKVSMLTHSLLFDSSASELLSGVNHSGQHRVWGYKIIYGLKTK